ncbi:MAG: hypothetical protein WAV46_00015 [Candidatus Moraniibacteriota bacterium]
MAEGGKFDIFPAETGRGILGKISRTNKWIIAFFILILLGLGGYLFFQWTANRNVPEAAVGVPVSPDPAPALPQTVSVPAPESVPLFGDANYQSENFRVGDIAIGGEAEFLLTEDTPDPLSISEIRGEAFAEKNKAEVKLVLNWKTNKLAQSEVTYSKGSGQAKKTAGEADYALNHSLIIPGLDQASTYLYVIVSKDRFGNEITSDQHAVYTGSKVISLFDLIAGAVADVFGWAFSR